jgi:hypothetical protein
VIEKPVMLEDLPAWSTAAKLQRGSPARGRIPLMGYV